jgi:hypothetical protein
MNDYKAVANVVYALTWTCVPVKRFFAVSFFKHIIVLSNLQQILSMEFLLIT